jgi:hypothetical protein
MANAAGLQFLGGGIWSDRSKATIVLLLERQPTSDILLHLDCAGFVSAKCPRQQIGVSVNGTAVGEVTYSLENPGGSRSIRAPRELLLTRRGFVEILFRLDNDISPASLGMSADSRNLALELKH